MNSKKQIPARRDFVKTMGIAGAGLLVPWPTRSTFACGTGSPNDKADIAIIGAGGMGRGNLKAAKEWINLVAIADADERSAAECNKMFDGKAKVYKDYRSILDDDSIKLVHVATPDHWHAKPLIEAMYAGKDVYCEKPMTLTIDEGKLIRKVQKETGRVVQVGTQQRSTFNRFTQAIAIIQEGRLGKIKKMTASIGGAPSSPGIAVKDAPKNLDWDRWLGPAPKAEYRQQSRVDENGKRKGGRPLTNCHYEFRWWYEYSGGKLTDWGAHHVDIAVWALAANGQSTDLVSIGGNAEHPVDFKDGVVVQKDRYNTATSFEFNCKFVDGAELIIQSDGRNGVLIEGEKGRLFVSRGKLDGQPVKDLKENPLAEDAIKKAYKGHDIVENERKAHWVNFLDCANKRGEPISDVHSHMEMLNVCHLAGISARLGRDLKWDAQTETIVGDDQANSMLKRDYRKGYEIEMGQPATAGG